MTAFQRGNVTTRQERGLGPISFKRMLLAGGVAVILTMTLGRFLGPLGSCVAGALALALLLVMTQPREGLPTFITLLRALRGWLITAALQSELTGATGWLARLLLISPSEGIIVGSALFGAREELPAFDVEDAWTFLDDTPDEPGLILTADPSRADAADPELAGGG